MSSNKYAIPSACTCIQHNALIRYSLLLLHRLFGWWGGGGIYEPRGKITPNIVGNRDQIRRREGGTDRHRKGEGIIWEIWGDLLLWQCSRIISIFVINSLKEKNKKQQGGEGLSEDVMLS